MNTPRILTFNFHEPYLCLMAYTGMPMDVGCYTEGPLARPWQSQFRPIPDTMTLLEEPVWRDKLKCNKYDLIIAHNEMNAIDVFHATCPKILICHNRKTYLQTKITVDQGDPLETYAHLLEQLQKSFNFVFISDSKQKDYGIPGHVIYPGIPMDVYTGYTGEFASVLRVGNTMRERDVMFDVDFQDAVCDGFPNQVVGVNPTIPDSRQAQSFEALISFYRQYRCLLHVSREAYEDGYNLSMLEAMAVGMPVVALKNPTSPITHGIDGFLSYDVLELREIIVALLQDQELAKQIGIKGRETVASKFPIERFVEQWKTAIFAHAESFGQIPLRKEVNNVSRQTSVVSDASQAQTLPRILPHATEVNEGSANPQLLINYISTPFTTGRYFETAARKITEVKTAGFRLPDEVLRMWGFSEPIPHYETLEMDLAFDESFESMLNRLDSFVPDYFLYIDSGREKLPPGFDALKMPRVAYIIDSHVSPQERLRIARQFDFVFMAQSGQLGYFKNNGVRNCHWLPLACSPELHALPPMERDIDVSYVGSLSAEENGRRHFLLQEVAKCFSNHCIGRFWPEEMAEVYARSRIVVNCCHNRDVNMRVFEAMASGALLITDEADGLEELFIDGTDLIIYRSDDELVDCIRHYLQDDAAREQIARAGQEKVLTGHTYDHRLAVMLDVIRSGVSDIMDEDDKKDGNVNLYDIKVDDYYECPRHELLPHVPEDAKRILDVGCGAGSFGRLLKQTRLDVEVAGIEFMEKAAEHARIVLDKVVVGNIEEMVLPFENDYFDCIVCADVLEHLESPEQALCKLAKKLKPGGTVVISIPNIQFCDVLSMLSHGRWTYMDAGILDATHLRFFTRQELPKLIHSAGLKLSKLEPLSYQYEERLPINPDGSITMGKVQILDIDTETYFDFRTYQYLVCAVRPVQSSLESIHNALSNGNYYGALTLIEKAEDIDTATRNTLAAKANLYLGNFEKALELCRAILAIDADTTLLNEVGMLLLSLNQIDEANALFEQLAIKEPESASVQAGIGVCRLKQQQYDKGFELLKVALSKNYELVQMIPHLVEAAQQVSRLDAIEPIIMRYVEYYPGNFELSCEYAELLLALGRLEEARTRIETVLLFKPDHERALRLREQIPGNEK